MEGVITLCMAATPQRKRKKNNNSICDIYRGKERSIHIVHKTIQGISNHHKARSIAHHKKSQSTKYRIPEKRPNAIEGVQK